MALLREIEKTITDFCFQYHAYRWFRLKDSNPKKSRIHLQEAIDAECDLHNLGYDSEGNRRILNVLETAASKYNCSVRTPEEMILLRGHE